MAGIWNVNNVYNTGSTKISKKLSFELGEQFLARVVEAGEDGENIILKLLDGWKFSAKLKNPLNFLPKGLIKFQVQGYEDGKLQIVLVNQEQGKENLENDSIETLLKEQNINIKKEEYGLLEKMVKHDIPLTKDNISKIKTLVDFKDKMLENPSEENDFISKYIQSKNIGENTPKGENIKNILKGFFNELKKAETSDLVVLLENGIELTEENLKSFKQVFKESNTIYKELKDIKEEVLSSNDTYNEEDSKNYIKSDLKDNTSSKESITLGKNNNLISKNSKNNIIEKNSVIEKSNNTLEKTENKINVTTAEDGAESKEIDAMEDGFGKEIKNTANENIKNNKQLIPKKGIEDISKNIKDQVHEKTNEMKDIIKDFLSQKNEIKPEAYDKIMQGLKAEVNNFKVFNTVSNQYYYMDVPVNVNNSEYECKLIIKDDRKKGKKIDSKNVKIAASVKTINMGVVDALISASNNDMEINIKCDEYWIKFLQDSKEKILNSLKDIGYNIYININKKERELNLTNCVEFFNDTNLNTINLKA